ncbi:MAG: proteasome accessory factor PafA2 [Microlunatus sp.]|nr:proteasome accessory factor PafA2 [Microlunatus sp.]MDN5769295.1 proteasome accessory factor PafA2 [Microlunatus sp.]
MSGPNSSVGVRRIMGIETEYGIFAPACPDADLNDLSVELLAEYAAVCRERGVADVRWDYSGEAPTDDVSEAAVPVARLSAQERRWYRGTSTVLTNGARLYVDHSHPEYAAPEADTPRLAAIYDLAGRRVMAEAVNRRSQRPDLVQFTAFRNNLDGKGAAYGTHENYLVDRAVPFADLTEALVPFLVTRPVLCGPGRVGLGPASEEPGFQISPRADYIERVLGLETTARRPIMNTRDEPHADPERWRRLHVITSDANSADTPILLKLGTLSLLLAVLENHGLPEEWAALRLADPVTACRDVSRDLTLTRRLPLADGRELTALEVQTAYLRGVERVLASDVQAQDPQTAEIVDRWRTGIEALTNDMWSATGVEWIAKLTMLRSLAERQQLGWDAPLLAALDLQWSDVRPDRGLAQRHGAAIGLPRIFSDTEIARAEITPPPTTRAWLRGEAVRVLGGDALYAASWHSLVLDTGADLLERVAISDPWRGSRADVADLLQSPEDPVGLPERMLAALGPVAT